MSAEQMSVTKSAMKTQERTVRGAAGNERDGSEITSGMVTMVTMPDKGLRECTTLDVQSVMP